MKKIKIFNPILVITLLLMIVVCANGQTTDQRKLELVVENRHYYGVTAVAVSPNRKMLASTGGNIILWSMPEGKFIRQFGGREFQDFITFSPNGKLLAGTNRELLSIWDINTGEILKQFKGNFYGVNQVAFSPDEKLIASTDGEFVTIWDIQKGKIKTFKPFDTPMSVSFSLDGKFLAISGEDKTSALQIWEVATWKPVSILKGHKKPYPDNNIVDIRVWSVEFSPDGKMLATSSIDQSVKVWDWKTGKLIRSFEGFTDLTRAIAFSPDGKAIASADSGQIKLLDISNGKIKKTFGVANTEDYSNIILSMKFAGDGKTLVAGSSDNFAFWNTETGTSDKLLLNKEISYITESPDENELVVVFGSEVRLINFAKQTFDTFVNRFQINKYNGEIQGAFHSDDGQYLLAVINMSEENGIKYILWDLKTKKEVGTYKIFEELPKEAKFNTYNAPEKINGRKIKFSVEGARLKILNAESKAEIGSLIFLDNNDWAFTTPDGRFDGSEGALKKMHYVYGLEIINLEQLKEAYYEPNLLQKMFGYSKEPLRPIVPLENVKLYPEVIEKKFDEKTEKLLIKLKNRGGGIGETRVLVNGKLAVADARDESLKKNPLVKDDAIVTLTADLKGASYLKGNSNKIEVITSNYLKEIGKGNIQSRGVETFYVDSDKEEFTLPTLYAIVGGVSDYDGSEIDLRFAAKDAEDFSNALSLGAKRLFCDKSKPDCLDKVQIRTLSTSGKAGTIQPTKKNFKKAFADIAAKAKPEDIVVIYLAGHGVSFGTGTDTYFYLTKEARSASKEDLTKVYQTVAISSTELTEWLTTEEWTKGEKGIKALKQVLILDTCASGTAAAALTVKRDLSGDQIRAIEFLKDKTGTFVLMGSTADAPSYEASQFGQGLLTYSLLQAMKGAELDKGEFIDVRKLFTYAEREVPNMAKNIGGIQRPIVSAPLGKTFVIGQMTDAEKKKIELPQPKPIILRPQLGILPRNNDPLNLTAALRKGLDAESSYEVVNRRDGTEPILIYVDDDSFPDAIQISGTYKVEGDEVKVKIYLFKGDTEIAELDEISGTADDINAKLLDAVRTELAKLN